MTVENMVFEPIRAFNFRIVLNDNEEDSVSRLFCLSVESAHINLVHKKGRVTVRDFSDSGEDGLALLKLYQSDIIPEFRISLLDPFGKEVRTYVLTDNKMESLTLDVTNGKIGPGSITSHTLFFNFESVDVQAGAGNDIRPGVKALTLDYTSDGGEAEYAY